MEDTVFNEEELYNKKIADEFERLKNLPKAKEIEPSEEERQEMEEYTQTYNRIKEIKTRLEQLSQDFVQLLVGAEFEDLEERKKEFQFLHNELRELLGKEPRIYVEELWAK